MNGLSESMAAKVVHLCPADPTAKRNPTHVVEPFPLDARSAQPTGPSKKAVQGVRQNFRTLLELSDNLSVDE